MLISGGGDDETGVDCVIGLHGAASDASSLEHLTNELFGSFGLTCLTCQATSAVASLVL